MSRFFGNTPPVIFLSILRRILLPEDEPAPDRYDYPASPAVASRIAHHPLSVSMFFGIIIRMYYSPGEHPPRCFHAYYNEYRATVDVRTCEIIEGERGILDMKPIQKTSPAKRILRVRSGGEVFFLLIIGTLFHC